MDSFSCVAGFCAGAAFGLAVIFFVNPVHPKQIGYNSSEILAMKQECEKTLPRNQECVAEVKFVVKEEGK